MQEFEKPNHEQHSAGKGAVPSPTIPPVIAPHLIMPPEPLLHALVMVPVPSPHAAC